MADDAVCGVKPSEVTAQFPNSASEATLTAMLQAACDEINEHVGLEGEQTTTLFCHSHDVYLFLPRPISSETDIDSIILRAGVREIELETTQWRYLPNTGRMIERLVGGSAIVTTSWGDGFVDSDSDEQFQALVTYTPLADTRRLQVMIELVGTSLNYKGNLKSERAGDYSYTLGDYRDERNSIIHRLLPRLGFA